MGREEYLRQLKNALAGKVDPETAERQVSEYREYIREQMALGRTEEEVCAGMQDPRLLAKTIIMSEEVREEKEETGEMADGPDLSGGHFFSIDTFANGPWYQKLGLAAIAFAVLWLVLSLISSVVRILFLPVAAVSIVCAAWEQIKAFRERRA